MDSVARALRDRSGRLTGCGSERRADGGADGGGAALRWPKPSASGRALGIGAAPRKGSYLATAAESAARRVASWWNGWWWCSSAARSSTRRAAQPVEGAVIQVWGRAVRGDRVRNGAIVTAAGPLRVPRFKDVPLESCCSIARTAPRPAPGRRRCLRRAGDWLGGAGARPGVERAASAARVTRHGQCSSSLFAPAALTRHRVRRLRRAAVGHTTKRTDNDVKRLATSARTASSYAPCYPALPWPTRHGRRGRVRVARQSVRSFGAVCDGHPHTCHARSAAPPRSVVEMTKVYALSSVVSDAATPRRRYKRQASDQLRR